MSDNIGDSAISTDATSDRRVTGTRESLFAAFGWLMQRTAYEDIRVRDISDRANVVRSTFYEHFARKEDLLQQSIEPPFSVLAACAVGTCTPRQLRLTLEHFWDRRALIRSLLTSATLDRLTRKLSTMTLDRLIGSSPPGSDSQSFRLRAIHSAGSQIALVRAWLSGDIPAETKPIVQLILKSPAGIR
jgi:AcrR family transcriptional regulator